jgi:hypothetical protein
MARTRKSTPRFFKDTSKKYIATRAGRLGGRMYNQFSLQVESVYSDYLRVAILGNVFTVFWKDLIETNRCMCNTCLWDPFFASPLQRGLL